VTTTPSANILAALLELLIDYPLTLMGNPELLMDPFSNPHPLVAVTSCLEIIQLRQLAVEISEETSHFLAAGWSRGTNTAYQSVWKRWNSWCAEQQVDSLS